MTKTLLLGKEDYSEVIGSGINYQIPTLEDYDFLEYIMSTRGDLSNGSIWNFKVDVKTMLEGKHMTVWLWHRRYHRTRIEYFDSSPYFQVTGYGCPDEQSLNCTPNLYKVYGIKI